MRYQVVAAGSHGLGTTDRTRSNMPTKYQDGAAGSHGLEQLIQHSYMVSRRGFGRPYRLQGIRTGLHDLAGKDQDGAAGSDG